MVKKQFKKTSVPIFQIIVFLIIIWAILLPLFLYFMSTIIPKELHKSGCPFFVIGIVSIPIYVIFTALSAFFVGTIRPSIIFPAVLTANFLNIFLDATFIFGLFGLPAMGAFDAALASAISSIVSVGILIYFFTNDYNTQKYNTRKIKFDRKLLRKHIELGTPYALSDAAEITALYSFVILLNKVSETDLTVYNIALSLWIFFTFLTEGFQKGVIALAANCLGAGKENLIHKLIYSMLIITVAFAGITSLPMLVFSKQLLYYRNISTYTIRTMDCHDYFNARM